MPRIREYSTDDSYVSADFGGRRAQGSDFYAPGGDLGGSVVKSTEIMNDVAERQEVSDVSARLAKARADWTVQLQERAATAPAGDATFAGKFNEDFQTYIQKAGEGISTTAGRQAFERGSKVLGAHFVETAGLYQVKSAGIKAKQDFLTSLDENRNTLLLDPAQFQSVLKATQDALADPKGMYAKMGTAERAVLERGVKTELALSAVQGITKIAPELALAELQDGKWAPYLDADKTFTLTRQAELAIRAKDVEDARLEAAQAKAIKAKQKGVMDDIVTRLADPDPNKWPTAKEIVESNLPPVGEGSKEHWLNVLRQRAKEPIEVSIRTVPSVAMGLFERIHATPGDPRRLNSVTEIEQAYSVKKQLSWEDMTRLRKEFDEARTPEGERLGVRQKDFMKAMALEIEKSNPLMGKVDLSGSQKVYEFQYFVSQQVQAYRAENKNPYDLFDPSKPDYLGKPEVLRTYQKTMADSMRELSKRLQSAAPKGAVADENARKEGETIAQWEARKAAKK